MASLIPGTNILQPGRCIFNLDPSSLSLHLGPQSGHQFLETPYLYPRVAYMARDPNNIQVNIVQRRTQAARRNYLFINSQVRQCNWNGSGLNAQPIQPPIAHYQYRVFCATLFETIRGQASTNQNLSILEPGDRNRILAIGPQGYLQNFNAYILTAPIVHLTYVIDIQGILGACEALGWDMIACTRPANPGPVGPLRLLFLENIFNLLRNNLLIANQPQHVPRHVCFNVILRLKRVRDLEHQVNICNAVAHQFNTLINTVPGPPGPRPVIRCVNIWEAFGPRRAPSRIVGDPRIQVNNPGNCKSSIALTHY
jgi:hypothetical protein